MLRSRNKISQRDDRGGAAGRWRGDGGAGRGGRAGRGGEGKGGEGKDGEAMATASVILTPLCPDGCFASDCPQPAVSYPTPAPRYNGCRPYVLHPCRKPPFIRCPVNDCSTRFYYVTTWCPQDRRRYRKFLPSLPSIWRAAIRCGSAPLCTM